MKPATAAALCAALIASAFASTAPVFGPWGVALDYVDRSVSPGSDFFRYVNGGWLKTAIIPADRSMAGVNLEVDRGNEDKLRTIVTALAERPGSELSAEERKLRDLYDAFQDTAAIEAAGLAPIQPTLRRIGALRTPRDVAAFMGAPGTHKPWHPERGRALFGRAIFPDKKNPQAYALYLSQSGLGMPDRDHYLRDDKELAAAREAYRKYLADMLSFVGITDGRRAAAVYALEERIAKAHWPAEERRDEDKIYNP